MKVAELNVSNDLSKLLADVYVSGTGVNAKKALENMDGVSITYSDSVKRIPVLKDLKSGVSIEITEKLELASLTQLSKELGFGGTAYQAGNLLNKNFCAVTEVAVTEVKKKTSKDIFKECFDVEAFKVSCRDTLLCIVDSFIDVESLSDIDRELFEQQLKKVKVAFMSAEEQYEALKKDTDDLELYMLYTAYEEYMTLLTQESRFDCLPSSVQVMNERDDGYILVKSSDYMSVEDFITLQTKLKECAVEGTLTISKTVAWQEDGITIDSVAVTATLKLK